MNGYTWKDFLTWFGGAVTVLLGVLWKRASDQKDKEKIESGAWGTSLLSSADQFRKDLMGRVDTLEMNGAKLSADLNVTNEALFKATIAHQIAQAAHEACESRAATLSTELAELKKRVEGFTSTSI